MNSKRISERAFEDAIEAALLRHGPDEIGGAPPVASEDRIPYGDQGMQPGGYLKRRHQDYDRTLCLLPNDVLDFVLATQPKEWEKLSQHYGTQVKERFLKRVSSEIERRGSLNVLRTGVKDMGCTFRLAYFRPASGLNEETRRLYMANFFAVVRQVHYSTKNENSLDLVLFLNGIPTLHRRTQKPTQRPNRRGRDPPIQNRPRSSANPCWPMAAVWPISPSIRIWSTSQRT